MTNEEAFKLRQEAFLKEYNELVKKHECTLVPILYPTETALVAQFKIADTKDYGKDTNPKNK